MMTGAGMGSRRRGKVWAEAWKTAVEWWNASVKIGMNKSPNERWDKSIPSWSRELKFFGEMDMVRKGGLQRKLLDKGFDGMMVGYAEDSGAGVYRMYNLKLEKLAVLEI